jgi:hypothetical protein
MHNGYPCINQPPGKTKKKTSKKTRKKKPSSKAY